MVSFVFPTGARIDTDGDAIPATSTTWTWLSIRVDGVGPEAIEIYPAQQTPLILVVESASSVLAARAAYYLAKSMDTAILVTEAGPSIDIAEVEAALGHGFDITAATQRLTQLESGEVRSRKSRPSPGYLIE